MTRWRAGFDCQGRPSRTTRVLAGAEELRDMGAARLSITPGDGQWRGRREAKGPPAAVSPEPSSLLDMLLEELESVIVRLQDGIPCFPQLGKTRGNLVAGPPHCSFTHANKVDEGAR